MRAAVEMMSGAVWVRDRLEASGWKVRSPRPRCHEHVAPLACKALIQGRLPGSLAELCRRDLSPSCCSSPSSRTRALQRAPASAHAPGEGPTPPASGSSVGAPSSACGSPTPRLRKSRRDGAPRASRGAAGLAALDRRAARAGRRDRNAGSMPIDRELAPDRELGRARSAAGDHARRRRRCSASPWPSEIGERGAHRSPRKLIGYAGLARTVEPVGRSLATGASPRPARGRFAGRRSRPPTSAGRSSNPWRRHYRRVSPPPSRTWLQGTHRRPSASSCISSWTSASLATTVAAPRWPPSRRCSASGRSTRRPPTPRSPLIRTQHEPTGHSRALLCMESSGLR